MEALTLGGTLSTGEGARTGLTHYRCTASNSLTDLHPQTQEAAIWNHSNRGEKLQSDANDRVLLISYQLSIPSFTSPSVLVYVLKPSWTQPVQIHCQHATTLNEHWFSPIYLSSLRCTKGRDLRTVEWRWCVLGGP